MPDIGIMRHYRSSEDVYIHLQDANGGDVTGVTLGTSSLNCEVVKPDGTTYSKTTGQPAGTLTSLGNGMYKLKLWGDGQTSGVDGDLSQIGTHALRLWHSTSGFLSQCLMYRVASEFDIKLALTWTPTTGGQDQMTGCMSITRWWSRERLSTPLSRTNPISSVTIRISDQTVGVITTFSSTDMTEGSSDGDVYFSKTVVGLTGSRTLIARVSFTYAGVSFSRDIPIISRSSA